MFRRSPALVPAVLHLTFRTSAAKLLPAQTSLRHIRNAAARDMHTSATSAQAVAASSSAAASPGPLRTVEAAAPVTSDASRLISDTRGASIAFARWLAASGVRFNSTSDSRPLFGLKRLPSQPGEWLLSSASRVIAKGETIFKLPRSLALAPSSPLPDGVAAAQLNTVMHGVPANLWPLKNGLRLTYEYAQMVSPPTRLASADSFYRPYIQLLPSAFPNIPLFWTAKQIDDLQYQPLAAQVKARADYLRQLSPKLAVMTDVFGRDAPTVTDSARLGWAMSCVSSRAFQLKMGECANLPLIDMMNHSYANNCKVVYDPHAAAAAAAAPATASPDADTINIEAVRDIQPGEELTLNYGYHANDSFLLNYGFLLDENVADTLEVTRSQQGLDLAVEMSGEKIDDATWKTELKAQVLGMGMGGGGARATTTTTASVSSALAAGGAHFTLTRDAIDPVLVGYVKMVTANPKQVDLADRNFNYFLRDTGALAQSAEGGSSLTPNQTWKPTRQDLTKLSQPAARVLFSYLSLLQSAFPTTLQQDVEALQKLVEIMLTAEPNPERAEQVQREELAIRFRIGKKRILAEQMKRLQVRM